MKYVYKSVTALIALAVLPVLYFLPLFQYRVKSPILTVIGAGTNYMGDAVSLSSISELGQQLGQYSGGGNSGTLTTALKGMMTPLIVCAVFFILVVLTAITCAVLAFACKKKYPACCAAVFGIAFTNMYTGAMNAIIQPLADKSTTLANIIGQWWVTFVADLEFIAIGNAQNFVYVLFAGVLLWSAVYTVTEPKEGAGKLKAS